MGHGRGEASATKVALTGGNGGMGHGRGEPSATNVALTGGNGGMGHGNGDPSATAGLFMLLLRPFEPGSRIKTAKIKSPERQASFFIDEPSSPHTLRAYKGCGEKSLKMF